MIMRLAAALWGGQNLRRTSVAIADQRLLALVSQQAERIGLKVAPVVAYCEQVSIPVVVGVFRPLVLLPAALASGLAPEQLQSLLAHELAHVRRYDLLVNLLQRLIEAAAFFHPAVWYISRRIDTERENAADDLVLAAGASRVVYADALVRMAELSSTLRSRRFRSQIAALAASGQSPSQFKRRVLRLLEGHEKPICVSRGSACYCSCCCRSRSSPRPRCCTAGHMQKVGPTRKRLTRNKPWHRSAKWTW